MSVKFLLNANGGSLAFKKEVDVVTYVSWIEDIGTGDVPVSAPTGVSIPTDSKDVSIYRNGAIRIICSDESATWTIRAYEGTDSGSAPEKMAFMYDSEVSGTGTTVLGVEFFRVKYFYVCVTALSVGTLSIDYGPCEWEEAE